MVNWRLKSFEHRTCCRLRTNSTTIKILTDFVKTDKRFCKNLAITRFIMAKFYSWIIICLLVACSFFSSSNLTYTSLNFPTGRYPAFSPSLTPSILTSILWNAQKSSPAFLILISLRFPISVKIWKIQESITFKLRSARQRCSAVVPALPNNLT